MHFDSAPIPKVESDDPDKGLPWYKGLTSYHWFVFIVASLGWTFDTMDQQLFILARKPAITELLGASASDKSMAPKIEEFAGYSTAIFVTGWAIGGLIFGILGDRIGRAKTMILTILLYSAFTGLSAFSWDVWSFSFFRFLTGLGVGGEFAVGIALVAEVMPDRSRPFALGWLQALSAVGNMTAALVTMGLGFIVAQIGDPSLKPWRVMFLFGVLPAFLALGVMRKLKEPEKWRKVAEDRARSKETASPPESSEIDGEVSRQSGATSRGREKKLGSIRELFGDPQWRHNTIVGMTLAFSGVVGLWGIGFFSPDLTRSIFRKTFTEQGLPESLIDARLTIWTGIVSLLQNAGGFLGIYAFSRVTHIIGRRKAFAISFVLAASATVLVFGFMSRFSDILWMIPLMGFCQLTLFGGYAIYLPELFPTRLRSTGVSFCYNVGRLVAAVGPAMLGLLTSKVYAHMPEPMRYAGVTMCLVFLLGLIALPFAPETKGKPLPE
jgi:MFS family permease